jgi:hypothetical protein
MLRGECLRAISLSLFHFTHPPPPPFLTPPTTTIFSFFTSNIYICASFLLLLLLLLLLETIHMLYPPLFLFSSSELSGVLKDPLGILDGLWRHKSGLQLSPYLRVGSLRDAAEISELPSTISQHMV